MLSVCFLYKGIQVISAPCGSRTHTLHYSTLHLFICCVG